MYLYGDPLNMTGSSDYVSEPSWEFYDLLKDPKEDHNAYNDKEYAEVIKKMKQEICNACNRKSEKNRRKTETQLTKGRVGHLFKIL